MISDVKKSKSRFREKAGDSEKRFLIFGQVVVANANDEQHEPKRLSI